MRHAKPTLTLSSSSSSSPSEGTVLPEDYKPTPISYIFVLCNLHRSTPPLFRLDLLRRRRNYLTHLPAQPRVMCLPDLVRCPSLWNLCRTVTNHHPYDATTWTRLLLEWWWSASVQPVSQFCFPIIFLSGQANAVGVDVPCLSWNNICWHAHVITQTHSAPWEVEFLVGSFQTTERTLARPNRLIYYGDN